MSPLDGVAKRRLDDLAIFGGTPAFEETLHVGRPNLGSRRNLFRRLNAVLDRRWLTNNGPCVLELEQQVARLLGVDHCVAMCNGTVGLEVTVRALRLTGEVIVPAFTFVATAHALRWQGLVPVFCDIDPETHNLDPGRVKDQITPRTTAILGVHLWGRAHGATELAALARQHGLKLVFDAAHAFGCTHGGRMIGGLGDAEVFSFHATKFFNTLEGGAVTTNDAELATRLRLMRNFGFVGLDEVIAVGTNGKMNEFCAAMGLTSLEGLEAFVETNRRNYLAYANRIASIPGIALVRYDEAEANNYQYVVAEIDVDTTAIHRDHLMSILHAENVRARRYFHPGCHRMEPYRSQAQQPALPVTDGLAERVLVLPTGTSVDLADIERVCDIVAFAVHNAASIVERLAREKVPHP